MPVVTYPRADWEVWRDYLYGAGGPFRWQIGTGPQSPQPTGIFTPVPEAVVVNPVISEIPETWDELETMHPEVFEPILETRPGHAPDSYPQTQQHGQYDLDDIVGDPNDQSANSDDGEDDMAHDWGHLIRQGIGSLTGVTDPGVSSFVPGPAPGVPISDPLGIATGGNGSGGDCDGMRWSGGTPPKGYKVVNSCGVGVLRKVRRRRRRRLLTASDSRDIATIVGLVGKGQMASALINRR